MSTRRDFLKSSALASGAMFLPRFLSGLDRSHLPANGRKLVIIQQSGGNDGLNAYVPYRNDAYFRARPRLAVDQVIPLNDSQGLNPVMQPLQALFDEGQACLLNGVGYPNPNRSHFRSMDIWHSGSDSHEYWDSGWLGRYLDASCMGCAQPHQVIEVDDTLSLAVKGKNSNGLAVTDPRQLYKAAQDPFLQAMARQGGGSTGDSELAYVYKTLTDTLHSTEYLYESVRSYRSQVAYPANPFAKSLKLIAELICSGAETTVYYTSLSGFDTHVNQRGQQDRLLGVYAEALAAFVKDLTQNKQLEDTLILTFSEFGRRVEQNASGGTDHGKANNLLLVGGALRQPGVFNPLPDLAKLDDGDLEYAIDFRQVYATLLHEWLGADDQQILGRAFKKMPLI